VNQTIYLPPELQYQPGKTKPIVGGSLKRTANKRVNMKPMIGVGINKTDVMVSVLPVLLYYMYYMI
jgi:hypothetical protein